MLVNHQFGTCLSTFGNCPDRFCPTGYGGGANTLEEMLDLALKIEGCDGLELLAGRHVNDQNISDVAKMFRGRGLKICMVIPNLWGHAKWGKGSLAAPEADVRNSAIDEIKKAMDLAAALDCPYVDVWPGQDGFDYCFQADYTETWKWLRDGLAQCSQHNNKVRILVEYKPNEPRKHCFVARAAQVLLLLQDLDDVGVLMDVGHALQAGENMAEAAALLHSYGKLNYIHLNDNYRNWDDDMMVGSVHLVEYLELFYWLERLAYRGWLTLDIFPCREDGLQAANQSSRWIEALFRAVSRVGLDAFGKVIKSGDACKASELVRKALLT